MARPQGLSIDERIRRLEMAISRCGDETIKHASQQNLNKLYQQREAALVALARANVDAHLADTVAEGGPETIAENAYVLAFDALQNAGVQNTTARRIADKIAGEYR